MRHISGGAGVARLLLGTQADCARVPVVLLSGFLGSGKTTLVNALLRDPRLAGTAVAVNEFGPVPLDRDLIDHGGDRTVVLANGCLCCNLAGDMEEAVLRLFSRREAGDMPGFERLLIEPSGLADPAPIAQAVLRNPLLARAFRLESVVTVVDALFGQAQLARHPETRKQAAMADAIVLTKTDLTGDTSALLAELREVNPLAPLHVAIDGAVDPAALLPAGFLDVEAPSPPRSALMAEAVAPDPGHLARIASASLAAAQPLDWPRFDAWFRAVRLAHAESLLRTKGMLDVAGVEGPVIVHGVHHVMHVPVEGAGWPGPRASRLVLIADSATVAAIRADWDAALPSLLAEP